MLIWLKKTALVYTAFSNQSLPGDLTIIAINLNPDPFPFSLNTGNKG